MNNIVAYRCRTCLSENISELFDWNSPLDEADASEEITYVECYQECTQIKVSSDDNLPQTICYQCSKQMRDAYFFIKRAIESYQKLLTKQEMFLASKSRSQYTSSGGHYGCLELEKDRATVAIQLSPLDSSECCYKSDNDNFQDNHRDLADGYSVASPCDSPVSVEFEKIIIADEPLLQPKSEKAKTDDSSIQKEHLETQRHLIDDIGGRRELKQSSGRRKRKQQRLLCDVCPRTFKNPQSLREHAESHNENRPRNHPCDQCDRKFFTRAAFLGHVKIHDKNRKRFKCEHCDKSFFHTGSLTVHTKQHEEKTLKCTVCLKKYVRSFDLAIHMRSHSGDMPFKCKYCEKSFTTTSTLNKHLRRHEGYRYKCHICFKEYIHQSALINHRKEHTGLPLKCSLCGKGFVMPSKIRRHLAGVHKTLPEDINKFIVKTEISRESREYRARVINTCY